ncbi:Rv1733c family protein [Nocardia aurantiaca]|uniref:Transmembrane protein n=1 Tax=Nocardia aurantiaca TaxID=2675850 RepID=A0A6I3KY16_9NOCA|nr:hypothetical protein [Nocardia aurantiaca]MTE14301.1 hypothetical protein [Nocardia aurantiaca]
MRPWNTNPLMRASDRFESVLHLLMVVLMLFAVPVAAAVGTATYTRSADRISTENAQKTTVHATVLTEPKETQPAGPAQPARFESQVQWQRDGSVANAAIEVRPDTKSGSTVQIWLGPDGIPTDPPQQPEMAVWNGIGTGVALELGAGAGALALLWCVTHLLHRLHDRRWEAELRGLGRPIGT